MTPEQKEAALNAKKDGSKSYARFINSIIPKGASYAERPLWPTLPAVQQNAIASVTETASDTSLHAVAEAVAEFAIGESECFCA